MTAMLNLIFRRVGGDKDFKFSLENQGVTGRMEHAKSSDPATPHPKKTKNKNLEHAIKQLN